MKKIYYLLLVICFHMLSNYAEAQTAQKIYLSGTGYGNTSTWDFFCSNGRKSGYWSTIEVPSCWEQQGFGNYNYGRDYKTYGKNYRFNDEEGFYRKKFSVPASWKGQYIEIIFEGSMTDTEVKLNGKSVGAVHKGAFYQFAYDITSYLKYEAENLLEVKVSKMSSDKSVNNAERLADYWVFGGIYRPVYLEAKPASHICHVAIKAEANGAFECRIKGENFSDGQKIQAVIKDSKGKLVAKETKAIGKTETFLSINTQIVSPLLWTSETPNLYKLELNLLQGNKITYSQEEKFGFRTVEIKEGKGIFINGVQVKMKGVNRHCFWPEGGRTLNDSISLADALLLKQMNMNAVRCSHYPPDKKFLEYCDSVGIYVINELAGWQIAYSTEAGTPLVKEMVLRDRNHPSIIFWANGNEGGTNKSLDTVFTQSDFSNRPVIHPHHRPGNAFSGIDCDHYEDYYSTKKKLEEGKFIYMPTEMLHAQDDGGAGAGMEDFWELHWKSKLSGGVFVWAMIDEAVMRTDYSNRLDANGLNANDGILGPHREKEGSFYALRNIFSPVKLVNQKFDSLFVENRFHFTNLNQCTFQWELLNYSKPFSNDSAYTIVQKGKIVSPDIKPGKSGRLDLRLPYGFKEKDAVSIKVFDSKGSEIYNWILPVKNNKTIIQQLAENFKNNNKTPEIKEEDSIITLTAADISIQLNKQTGLLQQVTNSKASRLSFNNGPISIAGNHTAIKKEVVKNEDSITVSFTTKENMSAINWTIYKNGWVRLNYQYDNPDSVEMNGISFNYPENFVLGAKWLGKGPSRQWRNRLAGTEKSVYSNLYNNTHTSYNPIAYPEFKGYFGNMNWMEMNTVEGNFLVCFPEENMFVRLFVFYGLSGTNPTPALPNGNISFMDVIPAIGTKLALNINNNTASLGPQGNKVAVPKMIERNILFYFGTPERNNTKETYSRPEVDEVF